MRGLVCLALGVIVCCASILQAQSTNASLTGRITDPTKAIIVGAKVVAINVGTNVRYEGEANRSGDYYVTNLPPGTYRIEVEKAGFKTDIKPNVVLHVQDTIEINFEMTLGSASESVTVTAGAPMVDTQSATVKTTVDRNFAENMPMNGRSFQTLITLTPGVVLTNGGAEGGQFSVNGQRDNTNYFMVDGVGANFGVIGQSTPAPSVGGTIPAFTALGGTNGLVPVDALQEFTIQTSSYGAEYGRSPGGQVSIETRSGTNAFHGSAFDYFRNDAMDANNWFNNANVPPLPKAPERQNDFGGVFGGPLLKDRTFFFATYEGLRLREPATRVTKVPSLCLRGAGACQGGEIPAAAALQPILQSFPLPGGPEFVRNGTPTGAAPYTFRVSNPSSIDTGTIRIDQAVNKKLLLFGRYSDSDSAAGLFVGGPILAVTDVRVRTLTIGANWTISSKLTNSLRFNYSSATLESANMLSVFGGGKPFDTSILFPSYASPKDGQGNAVLCVSGACFGTQVGSAQQTKQKQWNVIDSSTYLIRNHALKFGVDYRRLTPDYKPRRYLATAIFFGSSVQAGIATDFGVAANVEVQPRFTNLSLYLEDTWKVSPRLTLNYGVRYELNPVPSEAHGIKPLNVIGLNNPSTASLAPSNAPLYSTRYDHFAPRLGVAYQISQSPQFATVLRAGFGMFYDLGVDTVASGYGSIPFQFFSDYGQVPYPSANLPGPPTNNTLTPPFDQIYGIDPHLNLPYTLQWNVTLEQALGANQSLSLGYVAAAGRSLLWLDTLYNFSPQFVTVFAIRNAASSDYHSLQAQFKRRLTHGFQALASYTYAHSLDNDSYGGSGGTASTSLFMNPNLERGASNFDVRHTFSGAATYDIPKPALGAVGRAILGHWSVDTIASARTALPVDLIGGFIATDSQGNGTPVRPDVIPGIPLYLSGAQCTAANGGNGCPGGRAINFTPNQGGLGCSGPFCPVPTDSNGNALRQGTLGRNAVRGLGAWQIDFALHRQFDFGERWKLEFRSELFNIFNHPNFGNVDNFVGSGTFGQARSMLSQSYGDAAGAGGFSSLYQIGGPRSIQLALKLSF
jgi:outer membrane receptor protein involved in Fe transport